VVDFCKSLFSKGDHTLGIFSRLYLGRLIGLSTVFMYRHFLTAHFFPPKEVEKAPDKTPGLMNFLLCFVKNLAIIER
jgi:hypothetical protein